MKEEYAVSSGDSHPNPAFCRISSLSFLIATVLISMLIENRGHGEGIEFFVSPQGNDAHAGTMVQPFRTLEAARDTVRRSDHSRKVVVWLRAGVYERENPFELTDEDSGTQGNPVVYRAWPGEEVRMVGGVEIKDWKFVKDEAILARLVPEASGNVLQVDLKDADISDYGQVKNGGIELFFDDQPMTLSRWPNNGLVTIMDLVEPNTVNIWGIMGSQTGKFIYEGDRPNRWFDENDIWVHGYWFWEWADERQKVESIDTENRIVTIVPPYHNYGYRIGQWFYWFNILAELDTPGEWFLDRESDLLYFWPPKPIESNRAIVSASNGLLVLDGVSHVFIEGVIIETCRGTAITMKDCEHVKIAGCVLRNLGSKAIYVDGGHNSGVVSCHIYQTGDGGIELRGGDRPSLTPGGHYADNNHIHHCSRWNRTYTPGIAVDGVGNSVTHNLINDAPYIAVQFCGNDHTIAFNEIHNVCLGSNNVGAIYAGRDWTMRGTTIEYNYLHDITGFQGNGCRGVHLDDMFSGTLIYGNIFYRVANAAFIGGGRDCIVENNIFVECQPSLHIDARGMDWASGAVEGIMMDHLNAMPYTSELWRQRYPDLVTILEDEPAAPKGNIVSRNISWKGRWDDVANLARPYITFSNNWVDQDPLFEKSPPESFDLQDESPVFQLGFQQIQFEEIGLYEDEYRNLLPEQ